MEYYNSVGWKNIQDGVFQNASREDLRPVVQDYVHRCRLRVTKHLPDAGKYLLDAGSGPIQYPEYLEYSRGYEYRVCLDISRLALEEARERIGDHGLMVLGDIAHLPFRRGALDGVVSLHAVHHIPGKEQLQAFQELQRVLQPGGSAVVVHSWGNLAPVQKLFRKPIKWTLKLIERIVRLRSGRRPDVNNKKKTSNGKKDKPTIQSPTFRHDYRWVRENLGGFPGFQLRVWRTISPKFSRAFVHRFFFGRFYLRMLYFLEERAPVLFAWFGQYPMIIYRGSGGTDHTENEG